jgi:hypothetical protein
MVDVSTAVGFLVLRPFFDAFVKVMAMLAHWQDERVARTQQV